MMHAPKPHPAQPVPMQALAGKTLASISSNPNQQPQTQPPQNQPCCKHCGTPHRNVASQTRKTSILTWQTNADENGVLHAPEHTLILELHAVKAQLENTNSRTLEPAQRCTITALVDMPAMTMLVPRDTCCPTRARELATRLQAVKGATPESQKTRGYGRWLENWAKTRELELANEERERAKAEMGQA